MSIRTLKFGLETFVCVAVAASMACSSSSSPTTAPSTTTAAPVVTPTPAVPATASVEITINPNPVGFSGVAITDSPGCAGSPNTWFYQQNLAESNGVSIIFTTRIDKFDQRVVNTLTNQNIAVPAKGALAIQSRWCSSAAVAHTAQSSFTGIDANGHTMTVDGPVVNLKSP
jgi:hypothetical protein